MAKMAKMAKMTKILNILFRTYININEFTIKKLFICHVVCIGLRAIKVQNLSVHLENPVLAKSRFI